MRVAVVASAQIFGGFQNLPPPQSLDFSAFFGLSHLFPPRLSISVIFDTDLVTLHLRYCFHFSFNWSDEIIRYLCIYMSFLGMAASWKYGTHIGVTVFVEKMFPEKSRKYFRLLSDIVTIIFLALLSYFGFVLVGRIVASSQTSPALHLPMYLIYGTVPASALLSIIQMLLQIFRHKSYLQPRE